jgi:hypothetical protein
VIRISSLPQWCSPHYSAQRLIGHVCEQATGFEAYSWPNEIHLGTYPTSDLASKAIALAALEDVKMLDLPIERESENEAS